MRQKFVIANWKMNGDRETVTALVRAISAQASGSSSTVICPPVIYMPLAQQLLDGSCVLLGAQNAHARDSGAYTGEIAIRMLREFGCSYVIVGHSERRQLFAETDQAVAEKFAAVVKAELTPILCVGETEQDREAGETQNVILRQLGEVVALAGIKAFAKAIVAYEPVWAIGTGNTATPEQAQEIHRMIRGYLSAEDAEIGARLPLLYGGSVTSENAEALFSMPDIDGGLVGGASLDSEQFLKICATAG